MALISVSLDDEHASLELRERTALDDGGVAKVLRSLLSHRNISAAVVTSTCLRTMVVVESERFHGAIEEITATLCEIAGVTEDDLRDALTIHFDRGVASHLFAVAAGLKSVVPGEYEILGQLRRALEIATDEHVTSPALTDLFQRAIASGRRVRNETSIARGSTSFAFSSVAVAREHATPLRSVVVIGAGQLASGIVKCLLSDESIASVVVVNRSPERAATLVSSMNDARVRHVALTALQDELATADVVFAAATVTSPVIRPEHVRGRPSPVVLVDLGLPHSIDRAVADEANVTRIDIATLKIAIDQALDERRDAVADAEAIVRDDVDKFLDDQRARGAAALVTQLREYFDDIVTSELARRSGDLDQLSADDAELVRSVVRGVVAKIAHRPTTVLKESAGSDQGLRLSEATRTLFDLS